ncbi:MAG TPA: permease prefix domain 1-containing protein [Streptosporangiaceae bacterium]|nr:permease prefix domain 1-containing protein [Streptosporangiaceae bacterium]
MAGLLDAIDAYRSAGLTAEQAARAAVSEFGDPSQVAGSFRPGLAASQARRVAITLVATGPLIGLLWATAAMTSHLGIRLAPPWQWAGAPPGSLVAFPLAAAAFAVAVWAALLTVAATGRLTRWLPFRARLAAAAGAIAGFAAMVVDVIIFILLASKLVAAPGTRARRPCGNRQLDPAHSGQAGRPPLSGRPRRPDGPPSRAPARPHGHRAGWPACSRSLQCPRRPGAGLL